MTELRLAREADIPRLIEMGERFRAGSSYERHLAANPEQMTKMAAQLIAVDGLLISERSGHITGMLGFLVFPHFLSGEVVGGEVFWWVEPEHRGDGLKLLREAERQATARGAKKMQMIAPTDQVARVYQHLGYDFVESAYQREL